MNDEIEDLEELEDLEEEPARKEEKEKKEEKEESSFADSLSGIGQGFMLASVMDKIKSMFSPAPEPQAEKGKEIIDSITGRVIDVVPDDKVLKTEASEEFKAFKFDKESKVYKGMSDAEIVELAIAIKRCDIETQKRCY